MSKILWLGSRQDGESLKALLASVGDELIAVDSLESAVALAGDPDVAATIVAGDSRDPGAAILYLTATHPALQVLVATKRGVPLHVTQALRAGAVDMVDVRSPNDSTILNSIQRAVERHEARLRERQFLLRLHRLNDEFLRNIIAIEKRNLELEAQVSPDHQLEMMLSPEALYRVLVIDDEPTVCELIKVVMEEKGYTVLTASTGEHGVKLFRQKPFPLVVTDKNLPGMDGLEVTGIIKRLRPETVVVMITGFGSKESAIEALNLGATAFLEKPFDDITVIGDKLDGLIGKQRDRLRRRHYLQVIKERNNAFLDKYRLIRSDLEAWLQAHASLPPSKE